MANTSDLRLTDGNWTAAAVNPEAVTIKSNGARDWQIAIKDTAGAPSDSLIGEMHFGRATWEGGPIAGTVYIRSAPDSLFAITVQPGV